VVEEARRQAAGEMRNNSRLPTIMGYSCDLITNKPSQTILHKLIEPNSFRESDGCFSH
jgi:hypothetical protein